jgi:heparanase 1
MIGKPLRGLAPLALLLPLAIASLAQSASVAPAKLPRAGKVAERFQSYNIEMVEITGGRFWKPYANKTAAPEAPSKSANQPAGIPDSRFEYRPPIDLSNPRLRRLARALGPAYLRVSGTWANTTWFQDTGAPPPAAPPPGFKGILTRAQWKGVIDFARVADAQLVTSFAVSAGTRDASGVWTPAQAASLLDFTRSSGGRIAAAEFMNEPTFAAIGGAPAGYNAKDYARDLSRFRRLLRSKSPRTLLLGPGGVGEGGTLAASGMKMLSSADILQATGPVFDAISYHSYGAVSSRCAPPGSPAGIAPEHALSHEWLMRSEKIEDYYAGLRDRFEPGKPLWNTETAEAACGGDRWASTFLDTFRYLNQLGISARRGVQVHIHNTLNASDYGLLDEKTYEPRPDYWAALLWRRLMGTTVLDAGASPSPNLYLYAHCLRGRPGGVALLAINADTRQPAALHLDAPSDRLTLTARKLRDREVLLNGKPAALGPGDAVPDFRGEPVKPGAVSLKPASITFFEFVGAENAACR